MNAETIEDYWIIEPPHLELGELVGKLSLVDVINKNESRLFNVFATTLPDGDYQQFIQGINDKMESGKIDHQLVSGMEINQIFQHSRLEYIKSIDLPHIYLILAKKAAALGETNKAWAFISETSYQCGLLEASHVALDQDGGHTWADMAKLGNQARKENTIIVQKEVIRILNSPPDGGWKNRSDTIKHLQNDLALFILNKDIKVSLTINNLTKWLREPDIAEAFAMNQAKPLQATK